MLVCVRGIYLYFALLSSPSYDHLVLGSALDLYPLPSVAESAGRQDGHNDEGKPAGHAAWAQGVRCQLGRPCVLHCAGSTSPNRFIRTIRPDSYCSVRTILSLLWLNSTMDISLESAPNKLAT